VKLKKPEDEKYFKDIVLNDILEEISNEVGEPVPQHSHVKKKSSTIIKKILSFFFIILLIAFIFTLFKLITDANSIESPSPSTKLVDKEDWKMESDRTTVKQHTQTNTLKKSSLPNIPIAPKTIEMQIPKQSHPTQTKVKTERERAKEALKQQMLN